MSHFFATDLQQWYQIEKRDLPWRKTDDPYRIWVSEIMLQQTRVDTVIPYYHRFLKAFPTVYDLANADQQSVLKLWEGLGYYSRGRNLHQAAKTVVNEFDGDIPSTYKEIIKLKGIGPYTAAAILSIAHQKPHAVVDGNVIRVLTRFYGIKEDVRSTNVKNQVQSLANDLIDINAPGEFNQALMELGATVCTPKNPNCDICPVSTFCIAYNSSQTDLIPYKSKAKKVPHHEIAVGMILNPDGKLLIALRPNNVMLGGLWEFPGGKKESLESLTDAVARELHEELGVQVEVLKKYHQLNHAYSHFKITLHAYWCRIIHGNPVPKSSVELKWVSLKEIDSYPFPKANKTLIENLRQLENNDLKQFLFS